MQQESTRPVSLVLFAEFLHIRSQSFRFLQGHRVVQRRTNASHRPAGGTKGHVRSQRAWLRSRGTGSSLPVSFQRDHPALGCSVQEVLLQGHVSLLLAHAKRYVHAASAGLVHGTPNGQDRLARTEADGVRRRLWKTPSYSHVETAGGVDDVIDQGGLPLVERLHRSAAPVVLDPVQHQAHDVDTEPTQG